MISCSETFRHIFTVHAQKRLFRSFRSKMWPHHSLRRPRFPTRPVYFHYRIMFTAYIWSFCAQISYELVTLTFDLLTLAVWWIKLHTSNAHNNFEHPTIIRSWVMGDSIWLPLHPFKPWPSHRQNNSTSIVHSKLDYCNSLYYGLPKYQINRLQHIQNALARTVVQAP